MKTQKIKKVILTFDECEKEVLAKMMNAAWKELSSSEGVAQFAATLDYELSNCKTTEFIREFNERDKQLFMTIVQIMSDRHEEYKIMQWEVEYKLMRKKCKLTAA